MSSNLAYQTPEILFSAAVEAITVRALAYQEAPAAWRLHKTVRQSLSGKERTFLMPKRENYFKLHARKGELLGAFKNKKLVGIVTVAGFSDLEEACYLQAVTAPNAQLLAQKWVTGAVGIVQSFCVLKNCCAAKGAATALIGGVLGEAKTRNMRHLFAQSATDNKKSLHCFGKYAFKPITSWTTGHKRCLLHAMMDIP
jgi:hypothetical protein